LPLPAEINSRAFLNKGKSEQRKLFQLEIYQEMGYFMVMRENGAYDGIGAKIINALGCSAGDFLNFLFSAAEVIVDFLLCEKRQSFGRNNYLLGCSFHIIIERLYRNIVEETVLFGINMEPEVF